MLTINDLYQSNSYYIFAIRKAIFSVMLTILFFVNPAAITFFDKKNSFHYHVDNFSYCSMQLLLHFCDKETNFQCHINHTLFFPIQLALHFCNKGYNLECHANHSLFGQSSYFFSFVIEKITFSAILTIQFFLLIQVLLHFWDKGTNFQYYVDHLSLCSIQLLLFFL